MNKDSVYSSERLTYRGITEADAPDIVRWRSNPANYRNFFNARPVTLEGHLAWFKRYLCDPTRYDFVIVDGDGRPVGTVGLSNITGESCEINYMIGEVSARGKGYAKEAVRAMTRMAVDELGVSRVDARILPHNEASMKVVLGGGSSKVNGSSPSGRRILFLTNNSNTEQLRRLIRAKGDELTALDCPLDMALVEEIRPDFVLSFNYRHIVPAEVCAALTGSAANVHCSMLPWNRGASPNFFSWYENTPKGVTVHELAAGLDQGRILLQCEVEMDDGETFASSYDKLISCATELVLQHWDDLCAGRVEPRGQEGEGSYHTMAELNKVRGRYPFEWGDRVSDWKEKYGLE